MGIIVTELLLICKSSTAGGPIPAIDDGNEKLDISSAVLLAKVDKFCYLRDMLNADERRDLAVTASVEKVLRVGLLLLDLHSTE